MFSTAFSVGVEELFGRWEFYRHAQFEIGLSFVIDFIGLTFVLLWCGLLWDRNERNPFRVITQRHGQFLREAHFGSQWPFVLSDRPIETGRRNK